jgi:hypothetical protein
MVQKWLCARIQVKELSLKFITVARPPTECAAGTHEIYYGNMKMERPVVLHAHIQQTDALRVSGEIERCTPPIREYGTRMALFHRFAVFAVGSGAENATFEKSSTPHTLNREQLKIGFIY